MAIAIYSACSIVSLACAILLLRAYARSLYRLLLWSGLCFAGLTINNILLFLDKIALPTVDLSVPRTLVALGAMAVLLYGLIWDAK
ncbi:MAG TPA: DUF5985 family protein [Reyranella sp.]|nr:DUF5985 family protein [Reyranella sp.]